MTKNILVPLANGVEEIEAVTIIDVLRRAGVTVRLSSVDKLEVVGANGIKIVADSLFLDEKARDFDGVVLPGGFNGANRFAEHADLAKVLKEFNQEGKLIAGICASPALVFTKLGLTDNKRSTCYPALKEQVAHYVDETVVVDDNLVTSQGPATALRFAVVLVEKLMGKERAKKVKADLLAVW